MKKLYRITAVLLASLTLFSGCARGKKTETAEAVETNDPNILTHLIDTRTLALRTGEAADTMTSLEWDEEQGELCFVSEIGEEREEEGETLYVLHRFFCRTDGETVLSAVPVPLEDGWWYRTGNIHNGILWYLTSRTDGGVTACRMHRFDPVSGSETTFDTDLAAVADGSLPGRFSIDGEGRVCALFGRQILVFDGELILRQTVSVPAEVFALTASKDGEVWIHYENGDAAPLDAGQGKIGAAYSARSRGSVADGADGYLFFWISNQGVFGLKRTEDGELRREEIANYADSGIPANFENLLAVGGGRVYTSRSSILPSWLAGVMLFDFVVHDPLPDVDLRTVEKIVVATRDADPGINVIEAARVFNASHPGYRIEIDDRSNDPPDINFPSPGGKMTLDMLTGGYKPDILLSGGIGTYIEQAAKHGLYVDLTPYIEADERIRADNLFGCVKRMFDDGEGGMWGITNWINFGQTLVSTREMLGEYADRGYWTPGEFLDFAEGLPEGCELLANLTRGDLSLLSAGGYRAFIDYEAGTCSFDSPDFARLLRFLEALPTEEEYRRTSPLAGLDGEGMAQARLEGKLALVRCQPDSIAMHLYTLFGTRDWVLIGSPTGGGHAGAGIEINSADTFVITTFCEKPDLAWEFIREAFIAGEVRGLIPALRSDYERMCEPYFGHGQINYFGQHPTPMFMPGQTTEFTEADLEYPGVLYTMQPEDAARMEEILDTAGETLLDRWNFSVWSILREEITAFLGGVGSAEECASKIQSRVSIYLAETH